MKKILSFLKKKDLVQETENTLSLKEFISKSLDEICEAVIETRNKHTFVAPRYATTINSDKATTVNFDIAVTVTNNTEQDKGLKAQAGGKFEIGVVKASAEISEETKKLKKFEHSKLSRINFSIPIYFQLDEEKRKNNIEKAESSNNKFDERNNNSEVYDRI
jgi:hypothetical protein